VSVATTGTSTLPFARLAAAVAAPYAVVVPYSNEYVAGLSLGLTMPRATAECGPTALTGSVDARGAFASALVGTTAPTRSVEPRTTIDR
jgi:hypothetical protein